MGLTPESAYYLRRRPGAESFAAAWEAALTAAEPPPPRLPLMSMQELMLILRNHRRYRGAHNSDVE